MRTLKDWSKYKPMKDERDEQIDNDSKSVSWAFVTTGIQILTIMCLVKGNSAWKGCLGALSIGLAVELLYKYLAYKERPYAWVGMISGLIGIACLVWFGITG